MLKQHGICTILHHCSHWFHCLVFFVCVFLRVCDSPGLVVFQLVFEALHSQEPRGYVVGWIIAISLLVGILIFLLLAVLLWKVKTHAIQVLL